MWVLRRIPAGETSWDSMSPWKGCLHIDREGRAWYATDLAQPTQFDSLVGAERCRDAIMDQFPGSDIQVVMHEEVFQKPLPVTIPNTVTVAARTEVQGWNWNNDDEEDNIPF